MKTLKELEDQILSYKDLTVGDLDPYYEKTEYANEKVFQDQSVLDNAVKFLNDVGYTEYDGISPSLCHDVNFYIDNDNDIEIVIDKDIKVYAFDKDVTGYFFLRNPDIKLIKQILNADNACRFLEKNGFEFFDIHCEE